MKVTVKIEQKSYEVEVGDLNSRPILAVVEGETFEVWPEETTAPAEVAAPAVVVSAQAARPAAPAQRPAAAPAPAAGGAGAVNAPLPGTIVAIKVQEGDSVSAGQEIMLLEAMKMNNSIRAPRAGTVTKVYVALGEKVRHGQALVEISG